MDGMEGVDWEAGVLLRFRQVCCPDICVFYPLPWFAATSSLQNMGSNARAKIWTKKIPCKGQRPCLQWLWETLAPWMVAEAQKRLGAAAGACDDFVARFVREEATRGKRWSMEEDTSVSGMI